MIVKWTKLMLPVVITVAMGAGLAAWKYTSIKQTEAAAANQPEPSEIVSIAVAKTFEHRQTTTSIGTVLALRSVTLRNEVSGTVRQVMLTPGQIVNAGATLVTFDISVEQAELKALQAQAALTRTTLARTKRLSENRFVSATAVDQAQAEYDVVVAQIARTQAIIDRKTIRAPFRARVGLADVHPGQYLAEGTQLTTLQGIDAAAYVDFSVAQGVAANLRAGDRVEIFASNDSSSVEGKIVATDAYINPTTRNAVVRASIEDSANSPGPGGSVRVRVPVGPPHAVIGIPASALRKNPAGDHVFVIAQDKEGKTRAHLRPVQIEAMLSDMVVVQKGLTVDEQVAATGSFKLREGTLVSIATEPVADTKSPK